MNPKERYYSGVARETIHRITANRENWTSFLATMARNYDFTYPEQVMIYAQRPNATLCKPYEEWNTDQYRRYVKRGSTGIALFVMNQDKPYLRYVFDVADTGVRRSSPSITPWRVTDENRRFIMDEMERVFQVPSEGILEYQLENIAINLAREYWDDFKKPILDIVADSFLEEYDEYNIEVAFKTAVANSVSYAIGCMSRQLGIHIAGFLIIRKVSGQGILYCRIILEKLSGVLKVKQIPKFKTRIRERNMNALCISHFLCFGEQFVFGRDRIRGIIVHITVCNDPYSIAIGYRKLIFALVFHSFPNQSEVIGFAPFGVAADHANINVGLAAAIMFKILWLGLRALRHNQNDGF